VTRFQCCCGRCKGCALPPIGPSSELTHAGRPYELTLLVSTVLVSIMLTVWILYFHAITGLPHTHALCMTQDVARYVKMRTGAARGLERYKIVEVCGNLELRCLWRPIGSYVSLTGLFKEPIIGSLQSKMAETRHVENRHDVIFFPPRVVRFG